MTKDRTSIIAIAAMLLLYFSSCKTTPHYSELAAATADSLKKTSTEGLFISGVMNMKARPIQDPAILPCPRLCATKTVYWAQVIYPVTVCFPPDWVLDGNASVFAKSAAPDSISSLINSATPITSMVSTTKLSNFNRLFCKTKGGPWIAEITDDEQCDNSCGEGSHFFTMKILGVQETLVWSWFGTMAGRPAEVVFAGEPWIRSQSPKDCDLSDLTNCTGNGGGGGTGGGGGSIPAKKN
jgi:hypothetical protein